MKRLRSSVATELPAALGQECVCSFHASEYAADGFPPWRCQFVCDSASREECGGRVWQERETEEGQGSRQLGVGGDQDWAVGYVWAWLLGSWAFGRWIDNSAAQYSIVCTVVYCTRACMMQTRMLVSVGRTRSFTTKLDASLAGAAARNLQPTWEVLRRR